MPESETNAAPSFATPAEAVAHIVANDHRFSVGTAEIRGVSYRVFPNAPQNLREMMQRAAANHGDGDFVVYQRDRLSYAGFCDRMNRIANALAAQGVAPGDRVALAMRNYPELLILMMAIASIGAVVVPLNAWWTADELDYAFGDCAIELAFADGPRAERIATFAPQRGVRVIGVRDGEAVVPDTLSALEAAADDPSWPEVPVAPDDDFTVMYSSGSTGHPKGVVLTHRGSISAVYTWVLGGLAAKMVANASGGMPAAETRPIALVCTPLFHVTATHPLWLQSIVIGAKLVLIRKWDPEEAVRTIEREKVTRMVGVPTQSFELMQAARRLGSTLPTLQFLGSGGAKRPPAQVAEITREMPGKMVATGWGMTETCAVGISFSGPDYVARPGAAGRLQPPLQDIRICDAEGRDLPDGEVGEIVVKSPANMRCYLNRPEETAQVLQDGWLRTGDLARRDADGVFTIVDRKKSIIIRGGENISAQEVEEHIHQHPAVAEAGVFPVPDERLGEVVGAGVVLREGEAVTADALCAFLAETLAPFKIPGHIWFRAEPLPRGATDKIDRRALRDQCLAPMDNRETA